MFQRILILTIYLFLAAITGIQKLTGNFPPEWFVQKFQHTLIHLFPGSLFLSYVLIVGLELFAAICFLLALIKSEFKAEKSSLFTVLGFNTSLLLFTVLFFGSFLAQDYENGFMDLGYFVFTVFLQRNFATEKANESR
jgi:hypothetical protein